MNKHDQFFEELAKEKVLKNDAGKLRYDLIPWEVLEALAQIFTYGLVDHEEESWREVEIERFYAADQRHRFYDTSDGMDIGRSSGIYRCHQYRFSEDTGRRLFLLCSHRIDPYCASFCRRGETGSEKVDQYRMVYLPTVGAC